MKLIKGNDYLERLISVIGTPNIKVLTGIRRSGKEKNIGKIICWIK